MLKLSLWLAGRTWTTNYIFITWSYSQLTPFTPPHPRRRANRQLNLTSSYAPYSFHIWCCQPKGDRLRSPNSTTCVFLRLPIDGGPLSLRASYLVALDTTDAGSRPTVDASHRSTQTNNSHPRAITVWFSVLGWAGQITPLTLNTFLYFCRFFLRDWNTNDYRVYSFLH